MDIHQYDAIVAGSGMGGMTAATLLANDGMKVLVLEAALHPGGCSSSYTRKGYTYESGATTLIGFDEHQPLKRLEEMTGIEIPRTLLKPSMRVNIDGEDIIRHQERERWIQEAIRAFGNPEGQRQFWELAFSISDVVWKVSAKNPFFPPQDTSEWIRLFTTNNPLDVWVLQYAFRSVFEIAEKFRLKSPRFLRFLDEQLMITAQSKAPDTPFLFGAAGITYTNYSNFYVPGGLLTMIHTLRDFIEERGGALKTKEAVTGLTQGEDGYLVDTKKGNRYSAPLFITNIPIWNMPSLTKGDIKQWFEKHSEQFDHAWGALTMGVATTDLYDEEMSLHHQLHLADEEVVPFTESGSVFVSMSHPDDNERAPEGERTLNISCHANPERWFSMDEDEYETCKSHVQRYILNILRHQLPGFKDSEILQADLATPVTWQNWVYRKKGRVGGIPQSMARSLLDWTPSQTPFKGLYLVGDTTYPGQGIPGVTLSGINVYSRIKSYL